MAESDVLPDITITADENDLTVDTNVVNVDENIHKVTDTPLHEESKVKVTSKVRSPSKKSITFAHKAGIIFPPTRISKKIKSVTRVKRISATAGVYMAAVLEYLTAEVLELSGNFASADKVKRIVPRHIMKAIKLDIELDNLVGKKTVYPTAGIVPFVHQSLVPMSKKKVTKSE